MNEEAEFHCSECGHVVLGPMVAVSMTIDCPECGSTVTAYQK